MNEIFTVTRTLKCLCLLRGHTIFELLAQLKGKNVGH